MLIDLVFVIAGVFAFYWIGAGWLRCSDKETPSTSLIYAILLGLSVAVISGAWTVALKIDPIWSIAFSAATGLAGWGFRAARVLEPFISMWVSVKRLARTVASVRFAPVVFAPLVFIYLQNRYLLRGAIAFRNGPDLAGWTSAAKYLCRERTMRPLEGRLSQQLGTVNILQGFRSPLQMGSKSVYAIPSYTDQINGEFLVGAHRTGLPALVATTCRTFGSQALFHTSVALMSIAVFAVVALIMFVAVESNIHPALRIVGSLAAVLNPVLLGVTMEGGFGELIAIPFLLAIVVCLSGGVAQRKYLPLSVGMLIGFSLASYLDLLLLTAAIGFFLTILMLIRRFGFWRELPMKHLLFATLIGFAAGWTEIGSLYRLTLDRLGSQKFGGWDQGRIPTLADIAGIFNWLPNDGLHNSRPGTGLVILSIFVSLYLLFVLVSSQSVYMQSIFGAMVIIYLVFMVQIYPLNSSGAPNNYAVFRLGGYLTVIVPLLCFSMRSYSSNSQPQKSRVTRGSSRPITTQSTTWILTGLLSVSVLSGYEWAKGWMELRGSSYSAETEAGMKGIISNYDLRIVGFRGGGSIAALALMGDVHFLVPSRGFQIPTRRSNPSRPLVYVVPSSQCRQSSCPLLYPDPSRYKRLISTSEISVYQGSN